MGNVGSGSGSQVMMIRPKEKTLDQPIVEFLAYFKRVIRANHWDDLRAGEVFPALLDPQDRVLDGLPPWTTFTELEELLLSSQRKMRDVNLAELMTMGSEKVRDATSLKVYQGRVTYLVDLVYPNFAGPHREQLVRDYLVMGLPDEVRTGVLIAGKTLDDVVTLASAMLAQSRSGETAAIRSRGQPSGDGSDQRGSKERTCYRCGKKGHFKYQCHEDLGNANRLYKRGDVQHLEQSPQE